MTQKIYLSFLIIKHIDLSKTFDMYYLVRCIIHTNYSDTITNQYALLFFISLVITIYLL